MKQAEEVAPPFLRETTAEVSQDLRKSFSPLKVTNVCLSVAAYEDPLEPGSLVTQPASFQAVI